MLKRTDSGDVIAVTVVDPLTGESVRPVDGKDDWLPINVTGKVRDPLKDVEMNIGDGTTQTIYFTTAGDWAGQSVRA